jgi:hypothetical protein
MPAAGATSAALAEGGIAVARRETLPIEAVERLRGEIKAKRRQVQDALEYSLQAGHYEDSGRSPLLRIFASFHGTDYSDGYTS